MAAGGGASLDLARLGAKAFIIRRRQQTDLVDPAGRHCGFWATSPIPFYELRIGATMELGRSGRSTMMMAAGFHFGELAVAADRGRRATGSTSTTTRSRQHGDKLGHRRGSSPSSS